MRVGDIIRLRKPHPCGSKEWIVLKEGVDFKIKCVKCGRELWIARERLKKLLVKDGLQGEDSCGR